MDGLGPTVVIGLLILLMFYRRARRQFGRQLVRPGRFGIRLGILALVGIMLSLVALFAGPLSLSGWIAGFALALLALTRTEFERDGDDVYYLADRWVGMLVLSLLLGRVVYRFIKIGRFRDMAEFNPMDIEAMRGSGGVGSLTLLLILTLIAYYFAFYLGVFLRSRRMRIP